MITFFYILLGILVLVEVGIVYLIVSAFIVESIYVPTGVVPMAQLGIASILAVIVLIITIIVFIRLILKSIDENAGNKNMVRKEPPKPVNMTMLKIWSVVLTAAVLATAILLPWVTVPLLKLFEVKSSFSLVQLYNFFSILKPFDTNGEIAAYLEIAAIGLLIIPLQNIVLIIFIFIKPSWAKLLGTEIVWFSIIFCIAFVAGVYYFNSNVLTNIPTDNYPSADIVELIKPTIVPYLYILLSVVQYFIFVRRLWSKPKKHKRYVQYKK